MKESRSTFRLILAIALLLLPILYVGSYCALVTPRLDEWASTNTGLEKIIPYRAGGKVSAVVFWPLEQIDRRLRPIAWETLYFGEDGQSSGRLLPPMQGTSGSLPTGDPFAPQAAPAPAPSSD